MQYSEFIENLKNSDPQKAQILESLRAELPPLLPRSQAPGYNSRSLANMDCAGDGPPERVIRGHNILYPRDSYLIWLSGKLKLEGQKNV